EAAAETVWGELRAMIDKESKGDDESIGGFPSVELLQESIDEAAGVDEKKAEEKPAEEAGADGNQAEAEAAPPEAGGEVQAVKQGAIADAAVEAPVEK